MMNPCEEFITPNDLLREMPLSSELASSIEIFRNTFKNIYAGSDPRFVVILGPCSIDNEEAALEYALKISHLQKEVAANYFLIMRVYLEKPRTTFGWQGLLNEPSFDSFEPQIGIPKGRALLRRISELGVPIATEFLSPFTAPYIQDLITWGSIGARTSGSITHRQLASNLSMPIGFKNSVEGCIDSAINGVLVAACSQKMLGMNQDGKLGIIESPGNSHCHLVLRGGTWTGPNYDIPSIRSAMEALNVVNIPQKILIDCSHQNSEKNPVKQKEIFRILMDYQKRGIYSIFGAMIESYLVGGQQKTPLTFGQSITDPCLAWEETKNLLLEYTQSIQCSVS